MPEPGFDSIKTEKAPSFGDPGSAVHRFTLHHVQETPYQMLPGSGECGLGRRNGVGRTDVHPYAFES